MSKEIYVQQVFGCARFCTKYDTNEKTIERVKYFLSNCRSGTLAITIKTPKEIAEEGANNGK